MKIRQQVYLKRENQSLVLELILEKGPITRAEIGRKLEMSSTSASRIVQSLCELELIKEAKKDGSDMGEVGGTATYFVVNGESVITIGVELDINFIRIGVMNLSGKLILVKDFVYDTTKAIEVVNFIVYKINNLLVENKIQSSSVYGVCIGLPGVIDNSKGVVILSEQLKWNEIPLKQMLRVNISYRVSIDNDLKLKALAEVILSQQENESVVIMGMGKGIGSALISNGEIYRGKNNFAGEIGHITVNPDGLYCVCGQQGCLNTYISIDYIVAEAKNISSINNMDDIVKSFEDKELWAIDILNKAAAYVVVAINNVMRAYNPDVIYLSGELLEEYESFRELIFKRYSERKIELHIIEPKLFFTKLNRNGVVYGAAISLLRKFIENLDVFEVK